MGNKVFFIVPVYKESPEVLRRTVEEILRKYENVVVVDDGTPTCSYHDHIHDLSVFYLRHAINLGQGAAIQTGMDYALRNGADILVHFDSDGQHNINDVPKMIARLNESDADIILGSRFLDKEDIKHVPFLRRNILKVATYVNWVFTGLKLTDAHNGLRVMNSKAAKKIRITENRQAHATQILYEVKHFKIPWKEYPTTVYYSEYSLKKGQKNIGVFNVLFDLVLNSFFK
jgi:glycosyltransferase involved in cell wall biosynthesis